MYVSMCGCFFMNHVRPDSRPTTSLPNSPLPAFGGQWGSYFFRKKFQIPERERWSECVCFSMFPIFWVLCPIFSDRLSSVALQILQLSNRSVLTLKHYKMPTVNVHDLSVMAWDSGLSLVLHQFPGFLFQCPVV